MHTLKVKHTSSEATPNSFWATPLSVEVSLPASMSDVAQAMQ